MIKQPQNTFEVASLVLFYLKFRFLFSFVMKKSSTGYLFEPMDCILNIKRGNGKQYMVDLEALRNVIEPVYDVIIERITTSHLFQIFDELLVKCANLKSNQIFVIDLARVD